MKKLRYCLFAAILSALPAQAATLALYATPEANTWSTNKAAPVAGTTVTSLSQNGLVAEARTLGAFVITDNRPLATIPSDPDAYWLRTLGTDTPSSLAYTSDYFQFAVSNTGTAPLELDALHFTTMALGHATSITAQYRLYYSTDNFATTPAAINLPSLETLTSWGTALSQTADLAALDVSINAGQTMTFRLAVADNSGVNTKAVLFQNIELTSIPEPASTLLGGVGLLMLVRRRRD